MREARLVCLCCSIGTPVFLFIVPVHLLLLLLLRLLCPEAAGSRLPTSQGWLITAVGRMVVCAPRGNLW